MSTIPQVCTSQDRGAKHQTLSRCSSEPSQPTHTPQHQRTTSRRHTEGNSLEPDESNTDLRADLTETNTEGDTTATQGQATDEVSHPPQEPTRKDSVIKTKTGPERSQDGERDKERDMGTEEENPNLLRWGMLHASSDK